MTYLLFFIVIGLTTCLGLTIQRLKQIQIQYAITKQKLKEAEHKLEEITKKTEFSKIQNKPSFLKVKMQEIMDQRQSEIAASKESNTNLQEKKQSLENSPSESQAIKNLSDKLNVYKQELNKLEEDFDDKQQELKESLLKNEEIYNEFYILLEEKDLELKTIQAKLKKVEKEGSLSPDGSIILKTLERNFYAFEKQEILIDILKSSLTNVRPSTRREHIINDIISNNRFESNRKDLERNIKKNFKGYRSLTDSMQSNLRSMGFELVSQNSNNKMIFCGDNRYMVAFAQTASDTNAGRNIASVICKLIL